MGWKRIFVHSIIVSYLCLSSGTGEADLYVYSDHEGSIHVTHEPREGLTLLSNYRSRSRPAADLSRHLNSYSSEIRNASLRYGVEEDLIRAVIKAESDFDPYAISSAGALGLMQLMPGTARRLGVEDSFNPAQNIDGGVHYLMILNDQFEDQRLAVAAYHAGENRVSAYGDVPPIPATLEYVDRVLHYYEKFKKITKPAKKIHKVILPSGEVLYTTSESTSDKGATYFKVD